VSATRTEIHRWRDLVGIVRGGNELRRRWPTQPGAIEMKVGLQPLRRVSWTVSVWASREALDEFVRSAHHVAALTPYRHHVTVRATQWTTTSIDRRGLWREAADRLRVDREAELATDRWRTRPIRGRTSGLTGWPSRPRP